MLLEIENLAVEVAGKRVLKDINLSIAEGETHVLLGPNGAGKSTLFLTILGFPNYNVVNGTIKFKGQAICFLLPVPKGTARGCGRHSTKG